MKLIKYFILAGLFTMIPFSGMAEKTNRTSLVYIIPIHEMIEPALVYVLHRQIGDAKAAEANAIIFTMDTPGGSVFAAEEIIHMIFDIDVPTYAFVESSAISAGALIAMAGDHIYMSPGSKIGDAMPYQGSPMGGAANTSDRMNEKMETYVAGLARTTAQRNGHNSEVAEAMVRPAYELKIGEEIICPEGQLLTLTNIEAEKQYGEEQKPLLSAGTVDNLEDLLSRLGLENAEVVTTEIAFMEKLGRLIPPIAPLLLMLGLLGIYIEIKTPGLGLPGLLGGLCLAVFFWGHHIAGLTGMGDVLIFALGIALLMVEILIIPGFGLTGILGMVLMMVGIFMAMVKHYPSEPLIPSLPKLELPIRNMSITIIGTALGGIALTKFLPKTSIFKHLSLAGTIDKEHGYNSAASLDQYIGQTGRTTSSLRPSGTAILGDIRLDVITDGGYIDNNKSVKVVRINGNHVFVEEINHA